MNEEQIKEFEEKFKNEMADKLVSILDHKMPTIGEIWDIAWNITKPMVSSLLNQERERLAEEVEAMKGYADIDVRNGEWLVSQKEATAIIRNSIVK